MDPSSKPDHPPDTEDVHKKELRQKIMNVQRDSTLSPAEKAKAIQALMTANWQESQRHKLAEAEQQVNFELEAEASDSWHDAEKTILGCKHYKRNAKLKAACCGRLFTCRLCHDDIVKDHKIDRYATESMFCMLCKKVGEIGQNCQHCGQSMGRYYCGVCKFIDDDAEKKIFHCVPCGLCRIGTLGVDVAHCDACGVCLAMDRFNNHKHIERQLHSDCPICGAYMFTSTQPVTYLPCGHPMHFSCFHQHLKSHTTCPICFKSAVKMTRYWREIDVLVSRIQMPAEYKDVKVDVLCNDCETKSADLSFHFYGVKCVNCNGYNTRILATRGYNPTARATTEQQQTEQPIDPNQILEEALNALEGVEEDEDEDEEDEDSEEMDEEDFELMDIDDDEDPSENDSVQE